LPQASSNLDPWKTAAVDKEARTSTRYGKA
jgi:hypothetical protein